jgi:hypothetical protein
MNGFCACPEAGMTCQSSALPLLQVGCRALDEIAFMLTEPPRPVGRSSYSKVPCYATNLGTKPVADARWRRAFAVPTKKPAGAGFFASQRQRVQAEPEHVLDPSATVNPIMRLIGNEFHQKVSVWEISSRRRVGRDHAQGSCKSKVKGFFSLSGNSKSAISLLRSRLLLICVVSSSCPSMRGRARPDRL